MGASPCYSPNEVFEYGQVDYEWVIDKVENWCEPITTDEVKESENDFQFEGSWYRQIGRASCRERV